MRFRRLIALLAGLVALLGVTVLPASASTVPTPAGCDTLLDREGAFWQLQACSGDGYIKIADRLTDCPTTGPEFSAFWQALSANNGNRAIKAGEIVNVRADIIPACAPAATTTSTVPDTPPPTTTVPSTASAVPTLAEVGPRGSLTSRSGTALPCGTYTSVKFTDTVELSACAYTFIDADIPRLVSRFASYVGPGPKVLLSHANVQSGVWFEDGGHAGWTIEWSKVYGGSGQALRPKGPGTITVRDSWLLSDQQPATGSHTETMQLMWGAELIADRVAFSRKAVTNNTVTAVFTFESGLDGKGSTLTDCEFGYFDGTRWTVGGGVFAVYSANGRFVRPRVHASQGSAWYPGPVPAGVTDAVYLP